MGHLKSTLLNLRTLRLRVLRRLLMIIECKSQKGLYSICFSLADSNIGLPSLSTPTGSQEKRRL